MGRNECGQIRVPAAEQHGGPPVIHLRETKSAVLRRDLDRERAHGKEIVNVVLRDLAGAINFVGIHLLAQIFPQAGEKFFTRGTILLALFRPRKNAVEVVATDE